MESDLPLNSLQLFERIRPHLLQSTNITFFYPTREDIEAIPSNLQVCSICTERFLANNVVGKTSCNHYFHYPCLLRALISTNSCPYCRSELTESTLQEEHVENSLRLVQREVQLNIQRATAYTSSGVRTRSRTNTSNANNHMNVENETGPREEEIIELESRSNLQREADPNIH